MTAQKAIRMVTWPNLTLLMWILLSGSHGRAQEIEDPLVFGDDVHVAVVIRPQRILKSKTLTELVRRADLQALLDEGLKTATQQIGVDLRQVQEISLLIDQAFLRQRADIPAEEQNPDVKNQLKTLGLAFHNYHDVHAYFTDDDGQKDDTKGNLSWRVHLLPYLDQVELYEEFHMDEPWDSDHNKTLIERMPEVFKTPGVDDKGKTAIHVFTGPGTPFHGDKPPRIRDFTDGTSHSVLSAIGPSDSAVEWTRPGGVDDDPSKLAGVLGLDKNPLDVLFADGSVRQLPQGLKPRIFQCLICCADGEIIPKQLTREVTPRIPSLVVRSSAKLVQQGDFFEGLLGAKAPSTPSRVGNRTEYVSDTNKLVFISPHVAVAGTEDSVAKLLTDPDPGRVHQYLQKHAEASFAFGIDSSLIWKVVQKRAGARFAGAGLAQSIRYAFGHIYLDQNAGTKFLEIELVTTGDQQAKMLGLLLKGLVQTGRSQLMSIAATPLLPITKEAGQPLFDLIESLTVTHEKNSVLVRMAHPEDQDAFLKTLGPTMKGLKETIIRQQERVRKIQRQNGMRQILLAFHNYHDMHNRFVNFNGCEEIIGENQGLSWRVHLLPFLNQDGLYDQFNLDEPWDSDHNKALINQMPDVFRVAGVKQRGHTSRHVFIGKETPFKEEGPSTRIRDIIDGTSNTFLVVEAGADTAEPWTKPGGIRIDGKDIIKSLGEIENQFTVGFADGAVRSINKNTNETVLLNLIRHQDGNDVRR